MKRLLATFGNGQFGRLGHGSESNELFPRVLSALTDVKVTAVAAGGAHTAAVAGWIKQMIAVHLPCRKSHMCQRPVVFIQRMVGFGRLASTAMGSWATAVSCRTFR